MYDQLAQNPFLNSADSDQHRGGAQDGDLPLTGSKISDMGIFLVKLQAVIDVSLECVLEL